MSLIGRNSDTHSHLSRRITKKHSGLHTVTPVHREGGEAQTDAAEKPRPFAPLQFDKDAPAPKPPSKSILGL